MNMVDFRVWIKTILILCIYLRLNEATETDGLLVCPGEQQTLMCSTNYTLLEWSVTTINQTLHEARSVPYEGQNPTILPVMINSTNFTFSKVSSQNTIPLVSIMTIMNINSNLEGTMVSCTGINSSTVSSVVLMKVLHVFDVNIDIPNPFDVALRTDMIHFGHDNFTVTLEWPQFSGETYSVVTIPETMHASFTTSTSVQLVMFYNTQYEVNVTATLCGHRNTINSTMIHYAQCDSSLTDTAFTDTIAVISGTIPALQGQNNTFSCFGESRISFCREDGRWDPDPTEICKQLQNREESESVTPTISEDTPQSTITASDTQEQKKMTNIPLLGSLVGVSFVIIISLISVAVAIVAAMITSKRRGLQNSKKAIKFKIKETSDNPSKDQCCEDGQLENLVYTDVFSSSIVHSKLHNQAPKLDDDQVDYAEVNHNNNTMMGPNNILSSSEVDSLLNLDNLLIQIKQDATQMWYQLGEALGIKKRILEKYTACSPEESIIEMLDYWIRSHSGQPTWKEVAEALRKIHLYESAQGIEMIYITGELSIAVDTDPNEVPQEFIINEAAESHNYETPPPIPPKGL